MKKKPLQQIEDFYVNLEYKGDELRKILAKDKKFQGLLKGQKRKLTKQAQVTKAEKKKYVLATDADFKILVKCKRLEKLKLTKEDKSLLKLIKAQLELDWRKSLLKAVDQLLRRYK